MADTSPYVINLGSFIYPTTYNNFIAWVQQYLTEIENGRQGQSSLALNFARIDPYLTEVANAREGQASLVANVALRARIAAPTFTGIPAAPTAAPATNTTQLATTAFVAAALAGTVGGTGLLALSISNAAAVALVNGQHDASTFAGVCTWTLPATPAAGNTVAVTPANARIDAVIARNGSLIMSLAENMTVNNSAATVTLRYINSIVGWRII